MSVRAADVTARAGGRSSRGGIRPTPRAVVLGVILLMLLFAMAVPLRTYLGQRSQLHQLQREEQVLAQQNTLLHQQVTKLNDPVYLQQLARECLGMVKPGQIAFVVTPKDGSPASPPTSLPC
jgi:cell division protein FtsB